MFYYSTNRQSPEVSLTEALFRGQAPDKGLYMPVNIPSFTENEIISLKGLPYHEIAFNVLYKYVSDTFSKEKLLEICLDAYDFDVPLEHVVDRKYIMRLDRGPTASFKDFAARMMARMLGALMEAAGGELVILTATSGDTGSAIAHAFYNVENVRVVVLFPLQEVSDRQRKQMTTLGNNIEVIGIQGKFDDCQAMAKQAFADQDLSVIKLTSANSINIGRILPQIVYYFFAYTQLADNMEKIVFSIPSGNFGNMMGSLIAMRMGLPIRNLIIATNENDEVPVYLNSAIYRKICPSRECLSNAMNVGHPSNFARVIELFGGHMDETGKIHSEPDIDAMRNSLWCTSISDTSTRNTIKNAWGKYKLLLEPHGSVAWTALEKYSPELGKEQLLVSLETAHPAKFPQEIESLLSFSPEIPKSLADIESKKEHYLKLNSSYNSLKEHIISKYA